MIDFLAQKDEMTAFLKKIVEIETPSQQKSAVDKLGKLLVKECEARGGKVEVHPSELTGNNIVARWGSGEGGILLMHHMDTVFPLGTIEKMPFYEKDGKIFGPGVLDMKGGIVISLTVISALLKAGALNMPITVLITSDEELGSEHSVELIKKLASEASMVLVMESGLVDGALKTWRKGVGEYFIKVKGRASHAGGAHDEGRNAIEEMAHQVLAIQKMTDYKRGTTLNVGVIQGGTVSNVVPEEANIIVDYRVLLPEEADRVDQAIQNLKPVTRDTTLEIKGGLNRPPMPNDDLMKATFKKAEKIAGDIGLEILAGGSGGGSDGNFVAPLGIPLLDGVGTYGEGLHSEREYIFSRSLPERAAFVAALIQNW
ncbi:MAG: M20 family metallopeptidase [Chloroflexota bacterium]